MWKDDYDKIENVFEDIFKRNFSELPIKCPMCEDRTLYFYMHRWRVDGIKGGLWIWCSQCQNFSHGTVSIPEWWSNCENITLDMLNALPNNLEEHKLEVATHYKKIMTPLVPAPEVGGRNQ